MTPFGRPVVPLVNISEMMSSGSVGEATSLSSGSASMRSAIFTVPAIPSNEATRRRFGHAACDQRERVGVALDGHVGVELGGAGEELDLGRGEAVVEWHVGGADLQRGQQQHHVVDAVGGEDADPLMPFDALVEQGRGPAG